MKKVVLLGLLLFLSGCGYRADSYRGQPVDYWVAQLRQGTEAERDQAAIALGKIGEPAVPELRKALQEPSLEVRVAALSALAKMFEKSYEALPDLIALLRDPEPKVQTAAAKALGRMEGAAAPAIPELLPLLESSNLECRYEVGYALCLIGSEAETAGPPLSKLLKDPDLKIRQQVARLIWKTQSQEVIPALLVALKDEDHRVRMYAGFSLRKLDKEIAAQHGYW